MEQPVRAVKALHITHSKPSIRLQEIPPYANPSWDIHWTCPLNIVSDGRPATDPLSSLFSSVDAPEKALQSSLRFNQNAQHAGRGERSIYMMTLCEETRKSHCILTVTAMTVTVNVIVSQLLSASWLMFREALRIGTATEKKKK